ncbi:hypothetical protein HDU76_004900 [Blyttiomyces sp. JEL0837]|nr:hypothetical protein HDU76_004900 [Blyttiomyces sp. JEL0837]
MSIAPSWWGRLAVALVIVLITAVPFTTQLLWVAPFDIAVFSIWVNYYLGVTTDPGTVPSDYSPVLPVSTEGDDDNV